MSGPSNEQHTASRAPIYISDDEVKELVSIQDIIKVVGNALEQYSAGEEKGGVVQPVRTAIPVKDQEGLLFTMPAYSQRTGSLGTKVLTLYSQNSAKGLPSHQAIILVFDSTTGSLLALVEGEALTALRTSAASANAIKTLVPKPPEVLCVVGSGNEARSHVHACRAVHNYREIRIWGHNKKNAEKCAKDVGGGAVVFESLESAVRDADVIVTVTLATEPVVFGKWLKPGAVICCIGGCRPHWRELDDDIMHNAVVMVDTREGAMKESGDVILSKSEIYAEIGEIISGSKPKPIIPDCGKKYYVFKSLGMAVEDIASAKLVYDRYKERNTELQK